MIFMIGVRHLEGIDKFLELGIILTASITMLYVFFEAFWKTYEEAVKDEEEA